VTENGAYTYVHYIDACKVRIQTQCQRCWWLYILYLIFLFSVEKSIYVCLHVSRHIQHLLARRSKRSSLTPLFASEHLDGHSLYLPCRCGLWLCMHVSTLVEVRYLSPIKLYRNSKFKAWFSL
jgi:hypothetical protein